jgi:hypothetical protein
VLYLRGFAKAGGEFSLVCTVSNFKKIASNLKSKIKYLKEAKLVPAVS